jgi:hypothetical protein
MVGEVSSEIVRCGACSAPLKHHAHKCDYCGCDNRIILAKKTLGLTEPTLPKGDQLKKSLPPKDFSFCSKETLTIFVAAFALYPLILKIRR